MDSFIRFRSAEHLAFPIRSLERCRVYVFRLPFYELLQTSVTLLSALALMSS